MNEDFDWSPNAEDVVIPPNEGVAVYLNSAGDIVIRAKADGNLFDTDPFVVVPVNSVERLIKRLRSLSGQE